MHAKENLKALIAEQIRNSKAFSSEEIGSGTMQSLGIDSLELARILMAVRNESGLRVDFSALAELQAATCTLEMLAEVFREEP